MDIHDDNTFDLKDPATQGDLMSYCGSDRWMSLYTWDWLYDHFKTSGSHASRVGLSNDLLSRTTSDVIAASTPYFYIGGTIDEDGTAALDPVLVKDHDEGYSDHTGSGAYVIQLLDKSGNVLLERYFDPDPLADLESVSLFFEVMPAVSGTRTIQVIGGILTSPVLVSAGPSTPQVTVNTPNGGEEYAASGTMKITWSGSDSDGDALTYTVLYSNDYGGNWRVLAGGISENYLNASLDDLPGGTDSCLVRVLVSDGINQGEDLSNSAFTKTGQAPVVGIISPKKSTVFDYGEPIVFESVVMDREDGSIPDNDIVWDSHRAGVLGHGDVITVFQRSPSASDIPVTHVDFGYDLAPGLHLITVTATDSEGMTTNAMVPIHIRENMTGRSSGEPIVDIKVNGLDGPADLSPVDSADITVSLDPNGYDGAPLEWWLYIDSTYGDLCWVYPMGWQLGRNSLGVLSPMAFAGLSMFNYPLPEGSYTVYFSLDPAIDGKPGGGWSDSVQINVQSCERGLTHCGGDCVDLSDNAAHCGNCWNFCREGFLCQDGTCVPQAECDEGLTTCDGECVDLSSDAANCGKCGNVCPKGYTCENGQCTKETVCDNGMTECNGQCVDLSSDAANCGKCGNVCPKGMVCSGGKCVYTLY